MKILITGGSGFIARNLTEQLSREYNVISVNRQKLNLLDSKSVADCLKSGKFDVAVHTANYDAAPKHSMKDPAKVLENNLKMYFNIASCRDYFGKMIYFGSGAEFSREHWMPKMNEDCFSKHIPTDQYGLSKYIMTLHALSTSKIHNLRLFGVFGKYEDWRVRLVSSICHSAALDLPVVINQNKTYDYTWVEDLTKIVKWAIDNEPKNKVYNVCSGTTIDFKTIAEKVIKMSGKNLEIEIKQEGLGQEYSGDNTLLLSEIGNFKFTSIEESIKSLYEWYAQQNSREKI